MSRLTGAGVAKTGSEPDVLTSDEIPSTEAGECTSTDASVQMLRRLESRLKCSLRDGQVVDRGSYRGV